MSALDNAWRAAQLAEQEASYGYGLLGPYVPAGDAALAQQCAQAHAALVDSIAAQMENAQLPPASQPADYPQLYPISAGDPARRLALRLEEQAATAWRALYAAAVAAGGSRGRALRVDAQAALTATAVRAVRWRSLLTPNHATVAFPGIPAG